MTIKDIDRGYRDLMKRVFEMRDVKVAVGIFETDGQVDAGDGTRLIEVATWNEFGTGTIPARSFIRAWFDENQYRAREALRRCVLNVTSKGEKPRKALEQFGLWLQAQIQVRIAKGIPPGNADATVAKKGSSKQLIDKGQLRSSVTFAIDLGTGDLKVQPSNAQRGREEDEKRKAREAKKQARKQASDRRRERRKVRAKLKKRAKKGATRAFRGAKKSSRKFLRKARRAIRKATR
jgi:hypothetical protein